MVVESLENAEARGATIYARSWGMDNRRMPAT